MADAENILHKVFNLAITERKAIQMNKRKFLFIICFTFILIATGCTSRESQPSSHLQVQESVSEPSSSQQSNIVSVQDSSVSAALSSSSQSSVSSTASDSEPSSQSAQNSNTAPSSSSASNIDPFGLLGEGLGSTGVAIVVYDSSADKHLELKKTEGGELLSKIDFNKFTIADMVQEITPPPRGALPDPLPEYTQGNYIMLGRMNGTLYIYETLGQALLLDEYNEAYYYDIPSDMYSTIKSLVDSL